MDIITVTFSQWEKWNPRKDIKHPSWFAMSNRITEDDQIQLLSDSEFRAFIHIFCLASQQQGHTAAVNLSKAERMLGLKRSIFKRTIEKLVAFGICTSPDVTSPDGVRDTSAPRTGSGDDTFATIQDNTIQDRAMDLVRVWNETVTAPIPHVDLARTRSTSPRMISARERMKEEPDLTYWREVIDKIQKSDFCHGKNDRGWVADFEFLVRKETHLKVMENKYSGKGAPKPKDVVER